MSPPTLEDTNMWIEKFFAPVACAAMLLGMAAAGAQEGMAYGRSQAPAPLQGTWDVVITPYNCSSGAKAPSFRSRLTFMAGGMTAEGTRQQ
jgi:hypothetical protein